MSRRFQQVASWTLLAFLAAGSSSPSAGQEKRTPVILNSQILAPQVPLPESSLGVAQFSLAAQVDDRGEGQGTLTLNPNPPVFDEFGEARLATALPNVELACSLKFVKTSKVKAGPPRLEEDWLLLEMKGKRITSRLYLAVPAKEFRHGRLLIQDRAGRVKYAIGMHELDRQPCHPGCFPAGTPVQTPQGARPIDRIKAGEVVTAVLPKGEIGACNVQSIFVTPNRLVKVQAEGSVLFTTQTQPLCLAGGGTRPAGELKPGDRVLRWQNGKVEAVKVVEVALTERKEKVFNLVLGGSEIFIAGGFLARSKPPAVAVLPAHQTSRPWPAPLASQP